MNRSEPHPGPTRLLARSSIPLLVATLACSGTIGKSPTGHDPMDAGGTSAGGTPGTGGSKAAGGTTSTGKGGSSSGGAAGTSNMSGSSFGGAGTGGSMPASGPRPVAMTGQPLYSRFVRLTNAQWANSVRDVLRLSALPTAAEDFLEPVSGVTDFDNNERVVIVDNTIWQDFRDAAEQVADQVTATDAALQNVVATNDVATFINTLGRRAFRRDLTQEEVTTFTAIHGEGSQNPQGTQSAFTKGANWVIAAMLQSPFFLYRTEMADAGVSLDGYEMAAKLSLWLRNTTPDDALLDAASSLTSPEGAATRAAAMLEDPSSSAVMELFHAQLYKFGLYDTISKDNVPGYSDALPAEFKEASRLFFERIFSENLGVRDIVTSTVGFAGPNMAEIYGVEVRGTGVQQVTLADRPGFYAQMPFLTLWAINDEPDSIHRGVRINLDTLCADPGLPEEELPPIPALEPNQSNRERITELTTTCGRVCHGEIINPIGFAFEDYDGLGSFRTMDNGKPVDTSGRYPFAEGTQEFTNATELMQIIANGTQAHQCYAKKLASYATSRDLVESERPLVVELGAVSQATGASLKDIMLALVKTDAFRTHVGGAQ